MTLDVSMTPHAIMAADLHRIVSGAALFTLTASKATHPDLNVLRTVLLESAEGSLIAVGTDRYTLGACRAPFKGGEPFRFSLTPEDAQAVSRLAKTAKCDAGARHCFVMVNDGKVEFRFSTGESLIVSSTNTGNFPKWRQLIPMALGKSSEPAALPYCGPSLARFAKIEGSQTMRIAAFDRGNPAVVLIGDHFVGLIMPQMEHAEYRRPTWLDGAQ